MAVFRINGLSLLERFERLQPFTKLRQDRRVIVREHHDAFLILAHCDAHRLEVLSWLDDSGAVTMPVEEVGIGTERRGVRTSVRIGKPCAALR